MTYDSTSREGWRVVFAGALLLTAVTGLGAAEKRMVLLNVEQGELPQDTGGGVSASLSEEHTATKDGISLKMAFAEKGGGWVGQYGVKRKDWTGFTKLSFRLFTALERKTVMSFVVKDKGSTSRKEWAVLHFEVKPGDGDYRVDLADLKAQSGRKLDIASVEQWHFSYRFFPEAEWEEKGAEAATFYLGTVRLLSE